MFKLVLIFALIYATLAEVNYFSKSNYHRFANPIKRVANPIKRVAPVAPPVPIQRVGQPGQSGPAIAILRNDLQMSTDGSYQYAYETQNGISAQEQASIRPLGPEQAAKSAQGSFSWTSPEGETITVTYIADENGYQPQGSHIPTPPPIPVEIQKALEYIAANPPPPEKPSLRRGKYDA